MTGIIACEESQEVTKAFLAKGHDFYSNDLQPCYGGRNDRHLQVDCLYAIREFKQMNSSLDFLGFHPDCTFLTNAGIGWLVRKKATKGYEWSEKHQRYVNWDRWRSMESACAFFKRAYQEVLEVGRGYVENPIMHPYAMELIGIAPTQVIQP